ncbi:putative baseplate assembly protein [Iningainema tapete]|uniref:Putative baseplate assembly protein n=1 Tax=Iningainema tapete BLCC-T55 TaxID=2748662 RepID=A0A8J6XIG7_9CYAN|nr:putative baseplate assembly protein [Iningainema tapete]MBD2773367.1 putative baseplate assembly protein [Iningainema tapete BLCC-T55]
MNNPTLTCKNERRRRKVRATPNLNGLDYLEVSDNQQMLTVYFLGKAPTEIAKENIRIEGGRRITDIHVIDLEICREEDPELDDYIQVIVDKPGDFSPYLLRVVELDNYGRPTNDPMRGFDPRYAQLQFNFKVNCPNELDCQQSNICPQEKHPAPEINYLAKDYASFQKLILDRLALTLPEWKERHVPDLGMTLVELLAYVGDHLSYYQDAVATEAYLETARQRISVRRHARLIDYQMHEGCNARTLVCVETDSNLPLDSQDIYFVTGSNNILNENERVLPSSDLNNILTHTYEVFEPMATGIIQLYTAHNKIYFYTWGDTECCLLKGATTATLKDEWISKTGERNEQSICLPKPQPEPSSPERRLNLKVDDIVIFEEVLGAKTGNSADADPTHRHAVRLTKVERGTDALYNQPIVEIAWAEEEALPFSLCISAIGQPPECKLLENISVVRANVILVDHGQTIRDEVLGKVPQKPAPIYCEAENQPSDGAILSGRFSPKLQKIPLTFRQPLPAQVSVSRLLVQEPHQALPQIILRDSQGQVWTPQFDLLASNSQNLHFVVEMDNDRRAYLRFGNGELGRLPAAETEFWATYRVGKSTSGNIGAEAITHVVYRKTKLSGAIRNVRNPLPARGGKDPESISEVKLFAPQSFRKSLQRAITADDYARLAQNYTDEQGRRVQRAAASLHWMGSWYAVLVAVDPLGKKTADEDFLQAITAYLYRYRRIGHDLKVVAARYVPLDIEMTVCVLPHSLRGYVKAQLLERFSNRKLPDGSLGFFHPDNLSFGDSITMSKLVAIALAVPGVESVTVTKLQRLNEEPNHELENGIIPLGVEEIAQVDNDSSFPEHGKFTLNLRGGR